MSETTAAIENDPFLGPVGVSRGARAAPSRWRGAAIRSGRSLAAATAGFGALVGFWALVAVLAPDLPTPREGFGALATMLSNPFHDHGGSDRGIGLQLWTSLQRVFVGFGLASLIAVPLGFLMGSSRILWAAINPVVQLLRPVSPLAWFPIGLVVFRSAPNASTFVILVTALWPTVINTASGVASVPQDHRDVARVFRFSRWKRIRYVTTPHSLPSILTGMRISMGIAWMVIVAVEMMSGSTGIGFFVWDAYNAGNLGDVLAAVLVIGAVGVALDLVLHRIHGLATYEEKR